MIVVSTWPLLLHAQAWLGGRRSLAVALMTITLLVILVVPLYFGIGAIVENGKQVADGSKSAATLHVPQPPAWLEGLPVVGAKLAARWQHLAAAGSEEVIAAGRLVGRTLN
jgi:predicted PurR-regulated permease PerM